MNKDEFVKQQAEAFLIYLNKRGSQSFELWSKSKDFVELEKWSIYQECLRIIISQGVVLTLDYGPKHLSKEMGLVLELNLQNETGLNR